MRLRALFFSALLALLSSGLAVGQPAAPPDTAVQRPVPNPISPGPGFQRAVEEGTRTRSGRPGPAYWTNTAAYRLDATVVPDSNLLRGSGTIRYHNNSPDTLRQVVLHLRQNIHTKGAMRNRQAEVTGGMTLDSLRVRGHEKLRRIASRRQLQQLGQGYQVRDTRLVIALPTPLPPDDSTTLSVGWHFQVPGADNFRMGQDGEVYYLGYWYPQIAVYDDVHGWRAQPYLGDGEFYMGYADYDVSITVPDGWLVGATGALQNPATVLTDSTLARLQRARAPGPDTIISVVDSTEQGVGSATAAAPTGDSTLTWRFRAERVRDFAFGTSDDFVWDATAAQTGTDTTMIHALYRPEARLWSRSAEFARFSIEHLSDMLVPYPYPHMTTVEGPIGGGMEYPMITHIGRYESTEGLFGVTYHEISHMWFPMLVGTDEKTYAWFDEGTTTFNETEGRDDFFPDTDAWAPSQHYYYRLTPATETPSMRHADRYPVDGPDRYVASYDKPAVMLHALRGILGEDTFFEAYRTFAERWAYKHPTPHDFFNTFEDVAGRDLDWFWRGTLYNTWTLDQAIASVDSANDGVAVTVADEGTLPMPVLLRATYADGRTLTRRIGVAPWLNGRRRVTVSLPSGTVTRITIDPNQTLPDLDRTNNTWTPAN